MDENVHAKLSQLLPAFELVGKYHMTCKLSVCARASVCVRFILTVQEANIGSNERRPATYIFAKLKKHIYT